MLISYIIAAASSKRSDTAFRDLKSSRSYGGASCAIPRQRPLTALGSDICSTFSFFLMLHGKHRVGSRRVFLPPTPSRLKRQKTAYVVKDYTWRDSNPPASCLSRLSVHRGHQRGKAFLFSSKDEIHDIHRRGKMEGDKHHTSHFKDSKRVMDMRPGELRCVYTKIVFVPAH